MSSSTTTRTITAVLYGVPKPAQKDRYQFGYTKPKVPQLYLILTSGGTLTTTATAAVISCTWRAGICGGRNTLNTLNGAP